jgi:hypothetical protein
METEMNAQHIGTSLDDFLAEEDLLEDATVIAVKRTIVWEIKKEMELQSITKTNLAKEWKLAVMLLTDYWMTLMLSSDSNNAGQSCRCP